MNLKNNVIEEQEWEGWGLGCGVQCIGVGTPVEVLYVFNVVFVVTKLTEQ